MSLMKVSPETQQRLAVLVPLAALGISLFLVYPTWGRYGQLQDRLERQRAELAELKASPIPPPGPLQPTADDIPAEPAAYLGEIFTLARASGCLLVGMDAKEAEPGKATEELRIVHSSVELEGQYPQIRRFLARLAAARRLYVVTGLTLSGADSGRSARQITGRPKAIIEIERYVVPAQGAGSTDPEQSAHK